MVQLDGADQEDPDVQTVLIADREQAPTAERAQPVDPALALLQAHQIDGIGPMMISRAGRRLSVALQAAQHGRDLPADLLLRQILTDLGITIALP